jgi:hypothetical protein
MKILVTSGIIESKNTDPIKGQRGKINPNILENF